MASSEVKKLRKKVKKLKKQRNQLREQQRTTAASMASRSTLRRPTRPATGGIPPADDPRATSGGKQSAADKYRPRPMRKEKIALQHHKMRVVEVEPRSATLMTITMEPAYSSRPKPVTQNLVEEYIRVIVPAPGYAKNPVRMVETKKGRAPLWEKPTPPSRKYTVQSHCAATGRIQIYVNVHPNSGPGSDWASTVEPGETVWIQGVKSGLNISYDYDYYLIITDESGLGGVTRWLNQLPSTARGEVLVQATGPDSAFHIDAPEGMAISWYQPDEEGQPSQLLESLLERERPTDSDTEYVFGFLVGESSLVGPARKILQDEWGLEKSDRYVHSYWKNKKNLARFIEKKDEAGDYERWTRSDLYAHAQKADLPNRSKMNRDELITGLRVQAQGPNEPPITVDDSTSNEDAS